MATLLVCSFCVWSSYINNNPKTLNNKKNVTSSCGLYLFSYHTGNQHKKNMKHKKGVMMCKISALFAMLLTDVGKLLK